MNHENHQRHQEYLAGVQHTKTTFKDYVPLILIFVFIVVAADFEIRFFTKNYTTLEFFRNFMGFFFLVFGFFKIISWKDFAWTYASYDIIAKRSMIYSYAYPAIELLLGVSFLLNYQPVLINSITLVIMSIGSIGVTQNLLSKNQVQCACLGTLIKVPLSKISLMEDLLMAAMALVTLVIII
ncbi:MAG: MauE/DoxX family redox-associated membrane protein [Patescibacteria group bacterium]